jgi:hypothetical protein
MQNAKNLDLLWFLAKAIDDDKGRLRNHQLTRAASAS